MHYVIDLYWVARFTGLATKQEELTVKFGQLNVRLERLDKDDPVFKIYSHIFR